MATTAALPPEPDPIEPDPEAEHATPADTDTDEVSGFALNAYISKAVGEQIRTGPISGAVVPPPSPPPPRPV